MLSLSIKILISLSSLALISFIKSVSGVHVRAWVNPLVYPRADENTGDLVFSIFSNMDDAENIDEAQEAVYR